MQTSVVNLTVTPDDDCFFNGFSYDNYKDCVTVTGAEYTFSKDDLGKGYLTIFNITDNVIEVVERMVENGTICN